MVVLCSVDTLSRRRSEAIRGHLEKVSQVVPRIDPRSLASRFEIVVSYGERISSNSRDWTFPSKVDSILCQYRELWAPHGASGQDYGLEHAYFHLLQHRGPDLSPVEVIGFHWHPASPVDVEQHQYNRRPHFHFWLSPDPLRGSHLVSTLGVSVEHQSTVEYLDKLLDEVTTVFAVEVLDQLTKTPLPPINPAVETQ